MIVCPAGSIDGLDAGSATGESPRAACSATSVATSKSTARVAKVQLRSIEHFVAPRRVEKVFTEWPL